MRLNSTMVSDFSVAARKYKWSRFCKGSSLTEFLLSLAITSALAVISIPNLQALTEIGIFAKSCRALKPALELGRISALTLGQPVEVALVEKQLVGRAHAQNRIIFKAEIPKGRAEIASSEPGKLVFRPNLSASPSSLRVFGASHTCLVQISLRGRIAESIR